MDWSLDTISSNLSPYLPVIVSYFIGRSAYKLTKKQFFQQTKHRLLDIYRSIGDDREPSEKEKSSLCHIFYDYAGKHTDIGCLLHVLDDKHNPRNFGYLVKAAGSVKYDETQKNIVTKGKPWMDDLAQIFFLFVFAGIPVIFLLIQGPVFGGLYSEYVENNTTKNAITFYVTYIGTLLLVVSSVYWGSSVNEYFRSMRMLTRPNDFILKTWFSMSYTWISKHLRQLRR